MSSDADALQALVDASDQPLFALDRELRYIAFNRAHATVMRALYGVEIALGGRLADYQTADADRETARANLGRALAGERVVAGAFSGEPGRERYFDVVHNPLTDADGTVVGVGVLATDVTERKRAEAALQATERERSLIYANVRDVVFHMAVEPDDGFRFVFVNPAFLEVTGLSEGQVVGKPFQEVIPEPAHDLVLGNYKEAVRTGRAVSWEEVSQYPAGTKHGEVSVAPIVDAEGTCTHLVGIVHDITGRKQAEEALRESERRFRSLFEDSPVAQWEGDHAAVKAHVERLVASGVADVESYLREHPDEYELCMRLARTLDANRAAVALFEAASHEELIARHAEIYPPGAVSSLPAFWAALLAGRRSGSQEEVNLTLSGRELHVLETASVAPGHEDDWQRVYMADVDMTERRRAEQEIRRLNAELERRVATRTAELEAVNKELEAFAYAVSHDLRAPLRAIDGFSAMVAEDAASLLGAEDLEHLARVRAAAQRMGRLIDDLLGLSRAARKELVREEVDVSALAAAVLAELAEAAPGRIVETAVAPGLRAAADPALLRMILANLLSNAWKFTGRHETGRIEVGAVETGGERAFYVRDDGAGFDMAYADRLFGAFQRLHSPGEFEGEGIGLATVQRLVARHGGRVWAEAKIEKGATFYFTLPAPTTTV